MVSDDPTGNNYEVTSIYHLTAAGAYTLAQRAQVNRDANG
jgi:hypothetical protein